MVVDTSAVVAILLGEADAEAFGRALAAAPTRIMSAVSRVELSFVVESRIIETFLQLGQFEIADVTAQQTTIAIDAFRRFGKGRHRAALNIGDCFAYALAIALNETLLFKGNDFSHTDIRPAIPA